MYRQLNIRNNHLSRSERDRRKWWCNTYLWVRHCFSRCLKI